MLSSYLGSWTRLFKFMECPTSRIIRFSPWAHIKIYLPLPIHFGLDCITWACVESRLSWIRAPTSKGDCWGSANCYGCRFIFKQKYQENSHISPFFPSHFWSSFCSSIWLQIKLFEGCICISILPIMNSPHVWLSCQFEWTAKNWKCAYHLLSVVVWV